MDGYGLRKICVDPCIWP